MQLLQDLRFSLRQLRKAPVFTLVAVVTLALGIGANTAIFTLLDQAVLRSLPVSHPEQLVRLRYTGDAPGHYNSFGGDDNDYFSYPMYRDLRDKSPDFAGLIANDQQNVARRVEQQARHGELRTGVGQLLPGTGTAAGHGTSSAAGGRIAQRRCRSWC